MLDATQPTIADADDEDRKSRISMGPTSRAKSQIKHGRCHARRPSCPPRAISDARRRRLRAAQSSRTSLATAAGDRDRHGDGLCDPGPGVRELGALTGDGLGGMAENVTVPPKTKTADEAGLGRSGARRDGARRCGPLTDTLAQAMVSTEQTYEMVAGTLRNVLNAGRAHARGRAPAHPVRTLARRPPGPDPLSAEHLLPRPGRWRLTEHRGDRALDRPGQLCARPRAARDRVPRGGRPNQINVNNLPTRLPLDLGDGAQARHVDDKVTIAHRGHVRL